MRGCSGGIAAAAMLVGWIAATARADEKIETPPSSKQIGAWIQQLDDHSFSVREAASRRLIQSGDAAIDPVAAAAAGNSLEVTVRTVRILHELATSAEGAAAKAAKHALAELAVSRHPAVALRARNALWSYQQRIAAALENSGAKVYATNGQIVAVNFDEAKALGENLRWLEELPAVESLSFSTPLMDDAGLSRLKGLPRLREINLYRSRVSDDGLKHLKSFPNLQRLPMGETRVTDQGLIHLADLTQLEYVGLRGNLVTDDGLVHLKNLTNLTGLYLGETKVTDAGLIQLQPLTKLNMLRLDHTVISDAGLEHLKQLTELESLDLSETRVTDAGVARLQTALSNAHIRRMPP